MGRSILPYAVALVTVGVPAVVLWRIVARRQFGTPFERATFDTLHTASLAAPPLRGGLTPVAAAKAATHLRKLLGSSALAITDLAATIAWEGAGSHHSAQAFALAGPVLESGRTRVTSEPIDCGPKRGVASPGNECPIRSGVIAPLVVSGAVVGTVAAYGWDTSTALVRAADEVARFVSAQLELAELDRSRTRLAEAEVRALRAQISPHFIYNSLTAIASFVRTDPERARELLLEFADFTRYSLRRHGDFTTLAEELRSIDRYLLLERARFGDRLQVTLRIAPEVLPVAVPFLCLQPLVENAIRHGLENKPGSGHITITAEDAGNDAFITIEDDGVGMDPEHLQQQFAGTLPSQSVGLGNVDERLRTVFGAAYGLVIETGVGAGTKVSVRVPKYRAGVRAS